MGFVGKIIANSATHSVGSTLFGTCTTAAATAAKVVTLSDVDTLMDGLTIYVKFQNSNTSTNPTLNVNGLGAKAIYSYGTVPPGKTVRESWATNEVVPLTYDAGSTAWRICNGSANRFNTAVLAAYPVGSIYMSVNNTSPATLFGGTWAQISNCFLLAAGSSYAAGSSGGEATHTLTSSEIPGHTHTVGAHAHGLNSHVHSVGAHNHGLNSHKHSIGAHSHGMNSHTHTLSSHTHGLNEHVHSLNSHTHGLNSHKHSIGAHSHGLNSHTHSIPALSGTAASNGEHTHTESDWVVGVTKQFTPHQASDKTAAYSAANLNSIFYTIYDLKAKGWNTEGGYNTSSNGAHTHSVTTTASTTGSATGNTANSSSFDSGVASGNTAGPSTTNTGKASGSTAGPSTNATGAASGSTANSTAFDSGAASGSTANSTAFDTGSATGNTANSSAFASGSTGDGGAHNNMPPYLAVYVWKRTA